MINDTPRPLYPRERPGTHCIGSWVGPGTIWTGAENLAITGIRSPDRPARSESLYRLRYPGPHNKCGLKVYILSSFWTDPTSSRDTARCQVLQRKSGSTVRMIEAANGIRSATRWIVKVATRGNDSRDDTDW